MEGLNISFGPIPNMQVIGRSNSGRRTNLMRMISSLIHNDNELISIMNQTLGNNESDNKSNIYLLSPTTNNNKNILKAPSILPKEYRKGQDISCKAIVRLRHNLTSYDCEIIVKVAIVVCIIAVQIKTIELQTTISTKGTNNIFNMISPASTCMGTIHKYYEKIKDATEERKP